MAKKLRWGLLSTAKINDKIIAALKFSKRNELLAIGSRSKEKADDYARENKIDRAYGSYDELILDPWVDVVYNPLPNHLHAEWTVKALENGKNVMCEKPMALTLAEMDSIIAAAKQHNKVVTEAFMYRSHPQTSKVKEIVDSGTLGTIKMIRGSYTYKIWDENDIRMDPQMGGGGLWDIGCYPLSYARAVLGKEPVEVFGWQVKGQTGVDELFVAQLRFPDDIFAQIDCSMRVPYHTFMEIIGDKATLNIPHPYNPEGKEKLYLTTDGKIDTIELRGPDNYISEVEDMADAVLDGKPPKISLQDSRADTAAILALFESARTGKAVKVADLG